MANITKVQSIEHNIADLANGWLKSYRLDYKLEQESLNSEIDQALKDIRTLYAGLRSDANLTDINGRRC